LTNKNGLNIQYSGKLIAKNTIYNLMGYGIPLVFAIAIIPFLIKGLGEERFGILSLAWVVIGYFSFFDFGIGKALTKIIAEKLGQNRTEEITKYFWTAFFLMLAISFIVAIVLLFFVSTIVYKIFTISESIQEETLYTFYILALSIPIVTTTAGIRGLLEAYQKFGIINTIRTFLGVSTFLIPVLCLFFTTSLFWIVVFLIGIRITVWVLYLLQCFKLNKELKSHLGFNSELIKPIFKLSGWMTVSNVTVPLIVYMDRFLIGALISAAAIAYYTTPYEVVSKLLVIPGAITGVLFPTFSANYSTNPEFIKKIVLRAIKYIFMILFPIVLVIITFSNEGLTLWLGQNFADESTLILQFLAAGVLFNSIAYIPFTFLEGIGRPDITAKLQLAELPIYLFLMWIVIQKAGINGAALVWFLRMIVDALLLFFFAKKNLMINLEMKFKLEHLLFSLVIVVSFLIFLLEGTMLKMFYLLSVLLIFFFLVWRYLLVDDEKQFLVARIKRLHS
jgi:O-antigen/teichoic acid export membrane protein